MKVIVICIIFLCLEFMFFLVVDLEFVKIFLKEVSLGVVFLKFRDMKSNNLVFRLMVIKN